MSRRTKRSRTKPTWWRRLLQRIERWLDGDPRRGAVLIGMARADDADRAFARAPDEIVRSVRARVGGIVYPERAQGLRGDAEMLMADSAAVGLGLRVSLRKWRKHARLD